MAIHVDFLRAEDIIHNLHNNGRTESFMTSSPQYPWLGVGHLGELMDKVEARFLECDGDAGRGC
jgi:hypothetical protein